MNRDRVLVPMSRSEAGWYDALGEGTGHGPTHRPIRAALDTDRDQLIEAMAKAIYMSPWTEMGGFPEKVWGKLGKHEREPYLASAWAVLALLEGADDE